MNKQKVTKEGQIILEETSDANYEPSAAEIEEYAKWLGIALDGSEQELMWIARQGLKAPLPKEWKPCKTPTGEIYYFNFSTGESMWDHPCDEQYKQLFKEEKDKMLVRRVAKAKPATQSNVNAKEEPIGRLDFDSGSDDSSRGSLNPVVAPLMKSAAERQPQPQPLPQQRAVSIVSPVNKQALPMGASPEPYSKASGHPSGGVASPSSNLQRLQSIDRDMREEEEAARRRKDLIEANRETNKALEAKLLASFDRERADLEAAHGKRIVNLKEELKEEEEDQKRRMLESTERLVQDYKKQMEAREAREKEEILLGHKKKVSEVESSYSEEFSKLKKEKEQAEDKLRQQISAAKRNLEDSSALAEMEVAKARAEALAAAEEEAKSWAEVQKLAMRQKRLDEAAQQVDLEIEPLKEAWRTSKRQEAMRGIERGLEKEEDERRRLIVDLDNKAAAARTRVAEIEEKLAGKKALMVEMDEEMVSRGERLPGVLSELKAKRAELVAVDRDLSAATCSLRETKETLSSTRLELNRVTSELVLSRQESSLAAAELLSMQRELYEVKKRLREESEGLGRGSAELIANERSAVAANEELVEARKELLKVQAQLQAQSQTLVETEALLAKGRVEAAARDVSLANELKATATGEYQKLEIDISSLKIELEALQAESDSVTKSVQSKIQLLKELDSRSAELKITIEQRSSQSLALVQQLSIAQREASDMEACLAAKRAELDRVAGVLINRQREVEFTAHQMTMTEEESSLLHLQRAEMEKNIRLQILTERQAMMSRLTADMHQEVEATIQEEKKSLLAALRSQYREQQANIEMLKEGRLPPQNFIFFDESDLPGPSSSSIISDLIATQKRDVRRKLQETQKARQEWEKAWNKNKKEIDKALKAQRRNVLEKLKAQLEQEISVVNEEANEVNQLRREYHKMRSGGVDQSDKDESEGSYTISECSSISYLNMAGKKESASILWLENFRADLDRLTTA